MSSAQPPTCGKSSLTSMPHWPYFLNANGDRISDAGLPLGGDRSAGQRLAVVLVEHRLRVEAVHLREAAVHEEEDDVLRLRRDDAGRRSRDRLPHAAPAIVVAVAIDSPTMPAKASMPKPLPMRQSASRRVTGCGCLMTHTVASIHEQEFVRAEQHFHISSKWRDRQQLDRRPLGRTSFVTPAIMPVASSSAVGLSSSLRPPAARQPGFRLAPRGAFAASALRSSYARSGSSSM